MFFLVALIILRFLGYYFARKISGPIETLSEISGEVAKGDLSKSVPVTTKDEIRELAKNFNHMVEGLREWERLPEMPLFSHSRLLIFEEKEAHHEKMHAHTGSHKIIQLRE